MPHEQIAVLGAGSWGCALAIHLARLGRRVRLWSHRPQHAALLAKAGENSQHLPGVKFPHTLRVEADLSRAVLNAPTVLVVVPSHGFHATVEATEPHLAPGSKLIWATKGLEPASGRFLHEVLAELLGPRHPVAILSGPSFAREVAAGLPTAITVASGDARVAAEAAACFHGGTMRVYTSEDVVGVELGGAVKNVLAIAAGISDGLGFGANSRAALITRGLAELVRLGGAVGARRSTMMGLAGLGDLILTCTDDQSRNRRFGLALGQGRTTEDARREIGQVVEGASVVRELLTLARRHGAEMPICEQVERVVHANLAPQEAVRALLARDPKQENA
jgi:glycerol-3-phosphate dehydrogenase (NAD(P)+)